jgi:hypothetical protein
VRTIDQHQIPQVQVLTPGVQLSGKVQKVQELEHAETTLCLQQSGFAKETVRTLAWIKGGRKPGYRRAPDTLSLPGVQHIDIQVYSRLHVVYPKQSSEHQFVKEMLYCKDEYPMGKDKYWVVPRYDTVLVQYGKGRHDGGTMDCQRIARLRCLFRTPILGGQQLAFVQWFKTDRDSEESTGQSWPMTCLKPDGRPECTGIFHSRPTFDVTADRSIPVRCLHPPGVVPIRC